MILEVARNLDDSGIDLLRCGHSCLDLRRIEWRGLRDPCARAQQQCEKPCATAQTKPEGVARPPIRCDLPLVCHGPHACSSLHTEIHLSPLGRRDRRMPPNFGHQCEDRQPPGLFGDVKRFRVRRGRVLRLWLPSHDGPLLPPARRRTLLVTYRRAEEVTEQELATSGYGPPLPTCAVHQSRQLT